MMEYQGKARIQDGEAFETVARFAAALREDEERASGKMGQAQPVYYAIRDKQRMVGAEGYSTLPVFRFDDGGLEGEFHLVDALAVYLGLDEDGLGLDWYDEDELEAHAAQVEALDDVLDANGEIRDDVSLASIRCILENLGIGEIIYVFEQWVICQDTMFLTYKDAKRHLEENRHHYTADAHVYCMTAWRSPEYERFIAALKTMLGEETGFGGGISLALSGNLPHRKRARLGSYPAESG